MTNVISKVYDTLQNALADDTLSEGERVYARGRDVVGDGGGGKFKVTTSDKKTDGGTCFIFDTDLSDQVSEQTTGYPNGISLSNNNISWRTFESEYGSNPEDRLGIFDLNGHNGYGISDTVPEVDLKQGDLLFDNSTVGIGNTYGDYGDNVFYHNYKYATSNRRLERVYDSQEISIDWWGTPAFDPNNAVSSDRQLKWALTVARQHHKENAFTETYMLIPGQYYYLHANRLPDGVILKGNMDSYLSQEWKTKGELRLMPGMALWYRDSRIDKSVPENRHLVHGERGGAPRHVNRNTKNAEGPIGFENLRIDGNLRNNTDIFENENEYEGGVQGHLQDSGTYAGFYTTGVTGENFVNGMEIRFHNMDIDGMANMSFGAGGGSADFNTRNVRAADGERNHIMYSPTGDRVNDIQFEGSGWGSLIVCGDNRNIGSFRGKNFRAVNLEDGRFGFNNVISDRNGPTYVEDLYIDMRGITTVSGPADQGSSLKYMVNAGGGTTYKDVTIITSNERVATSNAIYDQRGNFNEYTERRIEDVEVTVKNGNMSLHQGNDRLVNHIFKDILIRVGTNADYDFDNYPVSYTSRNPGPVNPRADRVDYVNVVMKQKNRSPSMLRVTDKRLSGDVAHPYDVFWDGGEINYDGKAGTENDSGLRTWSYMNGPGVNFQAFWTDVTLNEPAAENTRVGSWHSGFKPNGKLHLRNCDTKYGRVSDIVSNTYTSDAEDEGNDFVLIPTSLLSRPYERNANVTSGSRTVQSVEVANQDGSLRGESDSVQADPYLKVNLDAAIQSGNTITVEYTARVTPLSDYQTTGLFTARPVPNRSYTTGNGPFNVDLRGVFASQESKERIVYTASSDSTGVTTASVQKGNVVIHSDTEPTTRENGNALLDGDVWIDTTPEHYNLTDANVYRYDGSAFVLDGSGSFDVIIKQSEPSQRDDDTSLQQGDIWVNSYFPRPKGYRYDGSSWNRIHADSYNLQLTEQGTGTATITVDAEIPGVGTAQTTFDVTIS